MIFRNEFKDLFSVSHDYTLCHCISADIITVYQCVKSAFVKPRVWMKKNITEKF